MANIQELLWGYKYREIQYSLETLDDTGSWPGNVVPEWATKLAAYYQVGPEDNYIKYVCWKYICGMMNCERDEKCHYGQFGSYGS